MTNGFNESVIHLHNTGKSLTRIAKEIGTSKFKVTKVLVDNGLHKIAHRKVKEGKANCTMCGEPYVVEAICYGSQFICSGCLRRKQRLQQAKKRGLTLAVYNEMVSRQCGKCAICGEVGKPGRGMAIDHDHTTGKARALLCNKCNRGLGFFNDSTNLLEKAIKYLNEHSQQ